MNKTSQASLAVAVIFAGNIGLPTPAAAVVIGFEDVAPTGDFAEVGPNYVESGFNLFNPMGFGHALILSGSGTWNTTGSDFYVWNPDAANNPVTLTNVAGLRFGLTSLDVGSGQGSDDTSFDITGYLYGGGTVSYSVVDALAFSTVLLNWNNLTHVEFQHVLGNVSAIDNLNVTPIPLPAALWLMLAGIGGLYLLTLRRRKHTTA